MISQTYCSATFIGKRHLYILMNMYDAIHCARSEFSFLLIFKNSRKHKNLECISELTKYAYEAWFFPFYY